MSHNTHRMSVIYNQAQITREDKFDDASSREKNENFSEDVHFFQKYTDFFINWIDIV